MDSVDPTTLTDDQLQAAIVELEVALTKSQPGTRAHSQIEAAIDRLMAEADTRR